VKTFWDFQSRNQRAIDEGIRAEGLSVFQPTVREIAEAAAKVLRKAKLAIELYMPPSRALDGGYCLEFEKTGAPAIVFTAGIGETARHPRGGFANLENS